MVDQFDQDHIIDAVLLNDVQYTKYGKSVTVVRGTQVKVDKKEAVALIGNDHVMIFPYEYKERSQC